MARISRRGFFGLLAAAATSETVTLASQSPSVYRFDLSQTLTVSCAEDARVIWYKIGEAIDRNVTNGTP